jgi:microcystin-dependent protein
MSSPFLAEIRMFAGSFAPKGWAVCNGQLLPISQNTALFSLLTAAYGGDGKSNFGLPNLAGSAAMGQGAGSGLSPRFIGEVAGEPYVTLLSTELPSHNHFVQDYTDDPASDQIPSANERFGFAQGLTPYGTSASANTTLAPTALAMFGGSQPHNNMQPYLGVLFIIALQGIYPQRS